MKKTSKLEILYEDDSLIAVNKPPRMASVPSDDIPMHNSLMGVLQRMYADIGVVPYPLHRLDYGTSGVILFGKKEAERKELEGIPAAETTHKKYWMLVKGVPHGTTITKRLAARSGQIEVSAQTLYKVLRAFPGGAFSLVEAEILTGRRHQIRQHFASIGHPVILDSKYGDERLNRQFRTRIRLGRLFLHAKELRFFHPILKKDLKIEAPMPIDLEITLKRLAPPKTNR